jgi:hypothetical protein
MSKGDRMRLAEASTVAVDFLRFLKDVTVYTCIAGSVRRKKESVGDIELVVEPTIKSSLLNRLDVMLGNKTIRKAEYGEGGYRWGENYRGLMFMNARIEIFCCDADNRGYITWLRTGSADKNQYVMTRLKEAKYPVRFADGYVWHVGYDPKHPMFDKDAGYARLNKLSVADEGVLYALLGMTMMPTSQREEIFYRPFLERKLNTALPVDVLRQHYVGQRSMF